MEISWFVRLASHSHQIAEPPCRTPIWLRRRPRHDEVETHEELFQIDLEICTRLNRFQRIDRLVHDTNVAFRRRELSGEEGLDLANPKLLKMLRQAPITLFENRNF